MIGETEWHLPRQLVRIVGPLRVDRIQKRSSIPYSLSTRGRHICNHPDDLYTYTSNITKALTFQGYPVHVIQKQLFHILH